VLNFKEKFKSYGFIMAVTGAIIIFLQSLGSAFGFEFDEANITYIVDALCGVLIVLGIVVKSGSSGTNIESEPTENLDKEKETEDKTENSDE
jgi:uncharacterized membrane protein